MDTIDSGGLAVREKATDVGHQGQVVGEEGNPEVALRRWLTPYAAFFKNWASVASASAALVAGSGVLIAGPHFSRAGVPFAKLPLLLLTAAGLNFVLTTAAGLYLGLVAGFAKTRKLALGIVLFAMLVYFGHFTDHAGLSWGLVVYVVVPVSIGVILRHAPLALVLEPRASWIGVLVPALIALLYCTYAYPSIPAAMGGGRPRPVRIAWVERPSSIPQSGATYEVFRDEGFIYVAVESDEQTGPSDRFWRMSFSPMATFVAVPVAQVRSIVYLPWIKSFDHLPTWDSDLAVSPVHVRDAGEDGGVAEEPQAWTRAREEAADASGPGAEPAGLDGGLGGR